MDITRVQGDTYPEEFTLLDDSTAVDLTGATVLMNIDMGGTVNSITASITSATDGQVEVPFTAPDVDYTGSYRYEVEATYSNGTKATHTIGTLTFTQEVL